MIKKWFLGSFLFKRIDERELYLLSASQLAQTGVTSLVHHVSHLLRVIAQIFIMNALGHNSFSLMNAFVLMDQKKKVHDMKGKRGKNKN